MRTTLPRRRLVLLLAHSLSFLYRLHCTSAFFFFQAEDGIRDGRVTGVQTSALPISPAFPSTMIDETGSNPAIGPHADRPGASAENQRDIQGEEPHDKQEQALSRRGGDCGG